MISIFTPTHNTTYLPRLWESIKAQTYQDWEWVIVPNGTATIPYFDDTRIKIINYPAGLSTNIGALKSFACCQSIGEILAEVDHDDQITSDCLEEVAKAFTDKSIDFVYSNCAEVDGEGNPFTYDEKFGWRYRDFHWQQKIIKECICFDPSPASFSRIWYQPNHIRAWKKDFYNRIGGHDHTFDVLDDQDIISRSYINGKVKHINKCLYIYHNIPGWNTCKGDKNQRIQALCLDLYDKYIYGLCEKWCDLKGLRKIDLCGGIGKAEGYESVDRYGGDITVDLDSAEWPFQEGEVGLIRAHDAIEHLKDPINTMKNIHRILAPGGYFLSLTPSTEGRGAWSDATHVSFWNSWSFRYYTHRDQAKYIRQPVRFQLMRIKDFFPSEFHEFHKIAYVKADLIKLDSDYRLPGLIEI